MSNHRSNLDVLALVEADDTLGPLSGIMHSLKSYTAHRANKILGRQGAFWQHESYDHWARDGDEMLRIIKYIENNPVAAQLCQRPEDWPWSSARFRKDWPAGEPFVKS